MSKKVCPPSIKVIVVRDFVSLRAVIVFTDLDHQHTAFRIIIMFFFAKSIRIALALFRLIILNSTMAEGYAPSYVHIYLGSCYSGLWHGDPLVVILYSDDVIFVKPTVCDFKY